MTFLWFAYIYTMTALGFRLACRDWNSVTIIVTCAAVLAYSILKGTV